MAFGIVSSLADNLSEKNPYVHASQGMKAVFEGSVGITACTALLFMPFVSDKIDTTAVVLFYIASPMSSVYLIRYQPKTIRSILNRILQIKG